VITWAVIALLGVALLGFLTVFERGVRAVQGDLDEMKEVWDNAKHLTSLTVTVASLDTRVTSVEVKVEGHDERFDSLEEKLEGHNDRFDTLEAKLEGQGRRFDALEEQIREQGRVLGDAIYALTEQFRDHRGLHAT
jgi:predicted nuclease with TOPRIM domain